jgi:lysozyme
MTASAQGQDRSVFQPVTSWDGCSFGIVKATEDLDLTDATFAQNWANLKDAGIPRGAYHFLHPGQDGTAQARHFLTVVKARGLEAGDMLWCDSETPAGTADECTLAFLREAAALAPAGVITGTYCNHVTGQLLRKTAAEFPELWFAWPSGTAPPAELYAPWKAWRLWQYGEKPFGDGNVDLDAYNGTEAELHAWLHPPVSDGKVVHWRTFGLWSLAREAEAHGTTPGEMIRLAAEAGHVYKDPMKRYVAAADWDKHVPARTILYAPERP